MDAEAQEAHHLLRASTNHALLHKSMIGLLEALQLAATYADSLFHSEITFTRGPGYTGASCSSWRAFTLADAPTGHQDSGRAIRGSTPWGL